MKKILVLSLASILFIPSLAFSNMITLKIGLFIPRAESDLWQDEFDMMDFNKSTYTNTNFGFAYEYFISREASLAISIDSYTKNKLGNYLDYVGDTVDRYDYAFDYGEGFVITHAFNVSITPLQFSLKFTPAGRRGGIIPYLGGGVGVYLWTVRIYGDWIDFSEYEEFYDTGIEAYVIGYPIYYADAREDNKISFGYHAFGGIMIPFGRRLTFEVEFKYNVAHGDLTEGFEGFEPFDLSGYQISLGINYWF